MKKSESAALLSVLNTAYPKHDLSEETIALYEQMLSDLDANAAMAAVQRIVTRAQWFPSIAEIREEATRDPNARRGSEAWADVIKAIARTGMNGLPSFDDPVVDSAVQCMGWRALCLSENTPSDRMRFAEIYDAQTKRKQEVRQLGSVAPPPKPLGEQKTAARLESKDADAPKK
jgi:hypothetical protein